MPEELEEARLLPRDKTAGQLAGFINMSSFWGGAPYLSDDPTTLRLMILASFNRRAAVHEAVKHESPNTQVK